MYKNLVGKFAVVSIEDPFDVEAWEAWTHLTDALPTIQIVGSVLPPLPPLHFLLALPFSISIAMKNGMGQVF